MTRPFMKTCRDSKTFWDDIFSMSSDSNAPTTGTHSFQHTKMAGTFGDSISGPLTFSPKWVVYGPHSCAQLCTAVCPIVPSLFAF